MKLFAGHRMQLSDFAFPLEQPMFSLPFVEAHPEYRCMARDGDTVDFLSYGYEEVQDYMIGNILESAKYGFDGVHLIFDRGQHLLFEAPVKERYEKKYGADCDFYRLPLSDEKLIDIKSTILTEFLQKLRRALTDHAAANGKQPMQIYITTYFSNEDALLDGFDIERFAEAGGNFDRERFLEGVIPFIGKKETFSYRIFDCSKMCLFGNAEISDSALVIVEGSYSHHPAFADTFDLRVFLRVDEAERKRRIIERNGEMSKMFFTRWIPLENRYFEAFQIEEKADLVIGG
jgi:hypothetical protein